MPAGLVDASLELAASGLAQTFSLTRQSRVGPQPTVLYRDRETWQPVVQVNAEQDLLIPDPTDTLAAATLPIRVHRVYLSWFGPDSVANVPASPDEAWLVLDATSQDDSKIGTRYLHYLTGLTAAEVTLTLPGGQPIVSQLFNPGTGETGVGVFDGVYAFSVPADITTATLAVAPVALQATVAYSGSTPVTVTARGEASFPITFPAVYQPSPQQAVTPDAQHGALSPASTGGGRAGGVPFVTIAALLAIALGGGAAVYTRNRRRAVAAAPGPALPLHSTFEPAATPSPPYREPAHRAWPEPADHVVRADSPPRMSTVAVPAPLADEQVEPADAQPGPGPAAQLAAIPAGPPDPPPGFLYVGVLGGHVVVGWPDDETPPAPVIELAVYLTLHADRPRSAEDLRDPLSSGKAKALSADTIRTYANTLRRVLGPERVPDAARRGYTLVGGRSDWQLFVDHRAAAQSADSPAEEAAALVSALALVRGQPYSDLPKSGYGWVATELLISEAEIAVTQVAQRLAELALTAGDSTLAA